MRSNEHSSGGQSGRDDETSEASREQSLAYKILGEAADPQGVGVLGRATDGDSTTYGVRGEVDGDGYGLYTSGAAKAGSLTAEDVTVNASITWPDGSTTTTSPGGGGSGGPVGAADAVVTLEDGTPTAVGDDGTTLAADSDAGTVLQAAADEAGVGGTVLVGPGTFTCDTGVSLHESQWLAGAGMFQTTLRATSALSEALVSSQDDDGSGRDERVRASEMTLDADDTGQTALAFFVH